MQITLHNAYHNVCMCNVNTKLHIFKIEMKLHNLAVKMQPKPSNKIFLQIQFNQLSPISVCLIIILPGLRKATSKIWPTK